LSSFGAFFFLFSARIFLFHLLRKLLAIFYLRNKDTRHTPRADRKPFFNYCMLFFNPGSHVAKLAQNSLCSPGWLGTSDSPVSALGNYKCVLLCPARSLSLSLSFFF
jgi:hypothetical protein